ncbi:MAG TPA: hypothetical protein PKL78_08540 [Anaerolineales bacterium]|nr:hypothetical protein [Anaerolineales bacterium]HNN13591.1 hypothetical protein [Anaerolineales bacterium]
MRKSTLFISAMLTVFMLATVFGVVSAYQQVVKAAVEETATPVVDQQIMNAAPTVEIPTAAPAPMVVTPEQATTAAIDFLGDTAVYSVEVVDYEGAPAYLVTFSSGDLVYVNSFGAVIANTKIQPVVVVEQKPKKNKNNNDGDGNTGGNASQNSGGGEDHEEHDDDDD